MDLKGRHFLTLKDYTPEEITYLLDLAADLKDKKKKGVLVDSLRGKNVALIFEKTSTRTRCAFEVAAHDLGMGTTYLDPSGAGLRTGRPCVQRFRDGALSSSSLPPRTAKSENGDIWSSSLRAAPRGRPYAGGAGAME